MTFKKNAVRLTMTKQSLSYEIKEKICLVLDAKKGKRGRVSIDKKIDKLFNAHAIEKQKYEKK